MWLLKDSDGLDRARLYDLDPSFLRHSETLRWVDAAEELYRATADLDEPMRIWEIASRQKLPVEDLLSWVERQKGNLRKRAPGS